MKIINAFYAVLLVMVFSFHFFAQKPPGDFSLREDAKPVLKENTEILIMNPEINVVEVGFRNSDEYNLGEKSAEATKSFFVRQSVKSQRISVSLEFNSDHGGDNNAHANIKLYKLSRKES